MSALPSIHAVTDDEILLRPDFPEAARVVMRALAWRGAVHLRARYSTTRRLYDLAVNLRREAEITGCWLIVNDRVDLALAAGVHAVQLTSRSLLACDARRAAPALRLGNSVHSVEEARAAAADGAEWCIAGPAFATSTHPGRLPGGPRLIAEIVAAIAIPVIAIGGVTPERVRQMRTAGAHGVAAIGGIWHAENVEAAARRYLSEYDASEGTR